MSNKITITYDLETEEISINSEFKGAVTVGIIEIARKLALDTYTASQSPDVKPEEYPEVITS